jgi:signal transduction histidine kinase
MRRLSLLLLFLMVTALGVRANKKVDSLTLLLKQQNTHSQKLQLLLQLCELNRSYALDDFWSYATQAKQLAEQQNDKISLAECDFYLALYYYRHSKVDSTLSFLEALKKIPITNEHQRRILQNKAAVLHAGLLMKQNRQQEAQQLYYTTLEKAIAAKDSATYLYTLNGIGWSNMELARYKEAIQWFQKAIQTPISEQYEKHKSIPYINLAACYGSENKIDSAAWSVRNGLKIARKYDDLFSLANGLNILGNVYIVEKNIPEAIRCLQEATATREHIGDPFFIVSDMMQLALVYASNKQFDTAITIANTAIRIANEKKLDAKMPYLYNTRADIYVMQGDYKQAYENVEAVLKYREEAYQNASVKELEELKIKYQTSLKEATIQKQQFELTRKNYMLFGSVALLVLMCLLAVLVFRNVKHRTALKLQKALATQREESARAILDVEEKERTRFARDLHDGLGPMLSAVKYNLSGISDKIEQLNEEDKTVFKKAIHILDESCKEVRLVSHNIMPNALLKKGLSNAIEEFMGKIDNQKLRVNMHLSGIEKRLNPKIEIAAYRVIQECVNNTIKHAEATQLDLSVVKDADGLSVTVEDNGKGFNPSLVMKNGIGLNNMIARVHYLKGEIEIDSRIGNGTLIAFHIP